VSRIPRRALQCEDDNRGERQPNCYQICEIHLEANPPESETIEGHVHLPNVQVVKDDHDVDQTRSWFENQWETM
jgi:hypothetical protein